MLHFCFAVVFAFVASVSASADQPGPGGAPKILILNSYHKEFPWTDAQVSASTQVLSREIENLELYVEYMDTKRILTDDYLAHLHNIYLLKYGDIVFDAIIATDDNALQFIAKHHKSVFNQAPVSFCGINDYQESRLDTADQFTGLVEVLDVEPTIDLALKLHPEIRKVYVIVDATPTGLGQRKDVASSARQYKNLEFEYLKGEDLSTSELLEKLRTLPHDSIVLLTVWLRDKNGEYVSSTEGGVLITANSCVPVYGIIDMYLGNGIVGGKLLSSRTHGRSAAEFVVRILNGEDPADIPVQKESNNPFMFDYVQLERWGIGSSHLPSDSIVINRPFSFYENYKYRILSVLGLFTILIALVTGLAGSIIRRKRAEEELQKEKDRLSALLSNIGDLVAAMDKDYTILFMSGELVKEFGERTGEKCYKAFCGLEEPCRLPCAVDEVIENGKDVFEYSHDGIEDVRLGRTRGDAARFALKDNRVMETVAHAFTYAGERCVMEVSRDITERKRAEEEKIRLEDQLRQAQKMEAVGQLAGGIAHDFNNLLQGILGYTEMAKSDLSPEDQTYQDMEQVKKGAERAATLTQQLLAFSRRQMIKPVDLDLNEIITEISRMLRRVIGEHIELDVKLGVDAGTVHADRGALEQVLMNLCVNARDAMPGGGRLFIETAHVVLDDAFSQVHPWASMGNYVLLSIADTGIGMPPDTVEHIFEPFFTTKETGKGTGLGLSMVYGIVKQHNGLVHCYSELSKGSCFKIYLPAVERVTEATEKTDDAPTPVGGTETILVAEDEEIVRDLTVRVLERSGYTVLEAKNGEEALRLFETHKEEIQFALLDVVMPKIGGREVYNTVRAHKPELPVLFSSGYTTNAIHTGFIVDAGLETIQKPYSPNALLRKIRGVLDVR